MEINYDKQSDVIHMVISEDPIIRDVRHGSKIKIGYSSSGIVQIEILDAAEGGYWPMPQFEPLHDVIRRLSADKPTNQNQAAEELLLMFEVAQLKGTEIDNFLAHLKAMGARVFARFPDGRELQLPITGFDIWQL